MNLESLGVFLQGLGTMLLALVTAAVGWRAAGALRIRIEGPLDVGTVVRDEAPMPVDDSLEDP